MPDHTYSIPISDLSFHQQETNTWCAATCAQMVLHYLSPHTAPIDQDILRTNIENRAHALEPEIAWFGAPDGLEATLNAFNPSPPGGSFRLVACQTESEVSRHIVWSLERHHVPAIALVYGMRHWLIVRGYTADRPPTGPNDTGYQIRSFDLYDPWPPVPDRQPGHWPPPHVDGTDGCGSGNERGIVLNHISYDGWRAAGGILNSGYMTGIPADVTGSKWKGQFLAIVDPSDSDVPPGTGDSNPGKEPDDPPASSAPPQYPAGRVSNHIALSTAMEALRQVAKERPDGWRDTLSGSSPRQPQHIRAMRPAPSRAPAPETDTDILRRAMMRPSVSELRHAPYYIVPFDQTGVTSAAVRVASSTGVYLQAVASHDSSKSVVNMMSLTDIANSLEGRRLDFDGTSVAFHKDEMDSDAPLGWKPCRESMSPFYPFYIITLNTRSGAHELYVRAHDGAAFTHLEDNIAGA
jgi:hypothetical protein